MLSTKNEKWPEVWFGGCAWRWVGLAGFPVCLGAPRGPPGAPGGPRGTPRNTGNPSRPIYPYAQPPNNIPSNCSIILGNIFGQFSKIPKVKITNYRSRNIAYLGIPERSHHIRLEKLMRLVRISAQTVQRRPQPRQFHLKKESGGIFQHYTFSNSRRGVCYVFCRTSHLEGYFVL